MANCKNSDDSKIDIQNLEELNYLAFKGGGGKGIVYLGIIDVLSHKSVGLLPLKLPISDTTPGNKQGIIGISGTSAGAITAYLTALGMSADQIRNESGILDPIKNPNYDPNYNPNIPSESGGTSENEDTAAAPSDQKFMPGENISGFNFEHFVTTDKPYNGYKRAVVFDEKSGKNILDRTTDLFSKKIGRLSKGNKELKDEAASRARRYKIPEDLIGNVTATHTKDEVKGYREATVYPSQVCEKRDGKNMREYIEKMLRTRKNRLHIVTNILSNKMPIRKMSKSRLALVRTIFKDKITRDEYIYNLLYDHGLFPGFAVQEYFVDVTFRRLPVSLRWSDQEKQLYGFNSRKGAEEMTFTQFFEWTGVDLVIGGLNITNGNQRNFSKDCTPDFPVVAAVMMSMNIPGLFKPVYVDAEIDKKSKEKAKLREEFKGYYVDAGLANNIPFHAFDDKVLKYAPAKMSVNRVNQLILGLAVQEGPDPEKFMRYFHPSILDPFFQTYKEPKDNKYLYAEYVKALATHETDPDFPTENYHHLLGEMIQAYPELAQENETPYNGVHPINPGLLGTTLFPMFGWLLNTILINATVSQTREPGAYKRVIDVYAYHVGTVDFKADASLTEFVIRRAREKTIRDLNLNLDPNKDF